MAAGLTYTPITSTTLGSDQSSVTLSSISSSYTNLVIVLSTKLSSANGLKVQFNSDTGTNYSDTILKGNGTTGSSARGSNIAYFETPDLSTTSFETTVLNINNYANTTTYKTALVRGGSASYSTAAIVGLWRSTAAINSITFTTFSGNMITGSTFTIYGITAA